ncbi:MAG: Wzz/FepE/Etk N-terminal domain-containing protein [Pseudomonadota bacterium]
MSDTERPIDIRDYIDAVLRRWFLFVIFVPLFGLVGIFVAYVLPPVYSAEARVLVESQSISSQLVQSTVTANTAERLRIIEQRLLTRNTLLELVERLELFKNEPAMTPSEKIALIRQNTNISPISVGDRRGTRVSAFVISFRSSRPKEAAAVVNEFVNMALEQNVQARSERAAETTDFFQNEAETLSTSLRDLEAQVSEFKRRNQEALPEMAGYRQQELNRITNAMFQREKEILGLDEEKRDLKATLDRGIDVDAIIDQLSDEQRELRDLERQLTLKRAVFADSHPQVKSILSRITALEAAIDPADRRRAEELVAERRGELEREISLIDNRRALLEKQQSDELQRRNGLEISIGRAPEVEMELNAMGRRYTDLQRRHDEAVKKLSVAETGEKLEINRQAERFEVIEQASEPDRPIAPNRRLIAASGFAGGVAVAFALIIFAELMNQAVRTASDLERSLNLRPVVTIPYIETEQEVRRRVWRNRVLVLLFLVIVPSALYAVDQFYLPLELLVERVLERSGAMQLIDMVKAKLAE